MCDLIIMMWFKYIRMLGKGKINYHFLIFKKFQKN